MIALDTLRLARRIDCLLAPWHDKPVPGVTIGVVQDGKLAIHRSAGLASLEFGVPIGPQTVFRIASVSKQFTSAAILMLAGEGRLALDDKASAYLPGLPDMGVTIRHLLHNTSGIRDMLEIMRMGGADLGTPVKPDDLLACIKRQRGLNFEPNTAYLYSNSNFLLLGRIAEQVSGETLGRFLHHRIFDPLGMTRTRLTERVSEPVADLATGYIPDADGRYSRAAHGFPLHGEGGLVSGVEDLALWSRYLDTDGEALAEELAERHFFDNGEENFYARGQTRRTRRTLPTVSHGGLWPGYRTEFLRVPDLGMTVIAITNNAGADPNHLGLQVLDILLDCRPGTPPVPPHPAQDTAQRIAGRWVSPNHDATLDASVEAGRLVLRSNGLPIKPTALEDGWVGTVHGSVALMLRWHADDRLELEGSAGRRSFWCRAAPAPLPDGLAGTYESPEIAARWTLAEGPDGWTVHVSGPVVAAAGPWTLLPIEGELMRVVVAGGLYDAWLDVKAVVGEGRVSGLLVNGGRVKRVHFSRVP